MPTITFHLFKEPTLDACYRNICVLVEKYYAANKSIFINTETPESAQELDDLLWIFHDVSFLPHAIYSENSNRAVSPILIGINATTMPKAEILINLCQEILKSPLDFEEIHEIVPNDEALKTKARERYKKYKLLFEKAELKIANYD